MNRKNLTDLVLPALLVFGLIVTGGCAGSETATGTGETLAQIIEDITAQEAFALIEDNENNPEFVILDVRTPEEFADGRLEDAVNLDFYSETFRDELDLLNKSKTYLIYCRSGNRSGQARDIMEELDFREVYDMGGILEWQAEGLPTVK
jgi:rhodanese-related sulfurtransferase